MLRSSLVGVPRSLASFITVAICACSSCTRCSPSACSCAAFWSLAVVCTIRLAYQAWPSGSAPRPLLVRVAGRYSVAMKPRRAR